MNDKMKHICNGSYTVEAAFIMPLILFVIIALCYLSFYMHDKIIIQSLADDAGYKVSGYKKHESDFETGEIFYNRIGERGIFYFTFGDSEVNDSVEEFILNRLKGKLFITEVKNVKVKDSGYKISIEIKSKASFPFHKVRSYFSKNGEFIITNYKGKPHNPTEFVRAYHALTEIISDTKGFQMIKEKFSALDNMIKQGGN